MTVARLGGAAVLAFVVLVALAASVSGADPSPAPIEPLLGGDPRSEGAGPGFVGNPLLILAGVVALGAMTVAVTALVARLSQRD